MTPRGVTTSGDGADHRPSYSDWDSSDLVDELEPRLRGYLLGMGGTCDQVDEIVNDVRLVAHRHWERIRDGRPDSYLFTVARNLLKKRLQKQQGHETSLEASFANVASRDRDIDDLIDRLVLVHRGPRRVGVAGCGGGGAVRAWAGSPRSSGWTTRSRLPSAAP